MNMDHTNYQADLYASSRLKTLDKEPDVKEPSLEQTFGTQHSDDQVNNKKLYTAMTKYNLTLRKDAVIVPACMFLAFFAFGFAISLGVMYAELVAQFDAQHAEVAMIQSINLGLLGITIVWNYPVNKFGLTQCGIVASFLGPLMIVIGSLSTNIAMLIVFVGILNGAFSSLLNSLPYFIMNKFIKAERHKLLAFMSLGGSLGQVVFSLLQETLIECYGWSGSLLITGGIGLNMVPCSLYIHFKTMKLLTIEHRNDSDNTLWKPFLFCNWKFNLVIVNALVYSLSSIAASKFLVDFASMKGFDRSTGAYLVTIIGFSNLTGRFTNVLVKICVSENSFLLLSIFMLVLGSSHVVFILTHDYAGLAVGSILNGLALGTCGSQLSVHLLEIYPMEHYNSAFSVWVFCNGIGNILGGYVGGLLPDLTDSYVGVFEIALGVSLFSSASYLLIHIAIKIASRRQGYTTF